MRGFCRVCAPAVEILFDLEELQQRSYLENTSQRFFVCLYLYAQLCRKEISSSR